jgi:LacI family transcriptional regulator
VSKRATIAEVATLAGVHKGTVSRALNEKTRGQVKPETVQRIQRVAKQVGYVPNVMARGLRTNSTMTVGVVIPDLTNPFFPPIVRGIEDYLTPRGYTALLANTDGRVDVERSAVASLLDRRVDGLIIGTGLVNSRPLAEITERPVTAVLVNRGAPDVPYPLVAGDDVAGVTAAVRHLAELGHRELLHIAGPPNLSTSRLRSDAFTWACGADPALSATIVQTDDPRMTVEAGRRAMDQVLESALPVTAVFAANDQLAVGVLRSLRSHGLECPRDVSVIGFNDMPYAEDFNPALTTVRVPVHEFGVEAARLLLQNLEQGTQSPVTVMLPVSLVVRNSTGPVANR